MAESPSTVRSIGSVVYAGALSKLNVTESGEKTKKAVSWISAVAEKECVAVVPPSDHPEKSNPWCGVAMTVTVDPLL